MNQSGTTTRANSSGLIPTLGIFSAVMLVAGGVIGSGIFRKAGVMAAQAGSPEVLLGVWLLAGVISVLGTLSNAEIAAMMPHTGGQYVFLDRAYGPFIAFLYGWALFSVIQSGSIAPLAYVFAEYTTKLVPPAPGLGFPRRHRHRAAPLQWHLRHTHRHADFVSWFFYAANAWAVVVLRRRELAAPRPFKVPGYPFVPVLFVAFGLVYLVLTIWNDLTPYRKAAAASQPAFLNCALGAALVLSGTPI